MQFNEDDLKEMVLRLGHEIRNPLSTIKSGVQLMQHLLKPVGEIADYFNDILEQVTRIDRTLTDMQRFVRLDVQPPVALPVRFAISRVIDAQRQAARNQNITLVVNGGPPDLAVVIDPNQLAAAITEVLDNAIRFSPRGSSIVVSWQQLVDGQVSIEIEDEGGGISPENEAKILRPFFSTSTKGTGLGLNIVDRICRLYGGRLSWRNRQPRGSCFSIVLPRSDHP